MSENPLDISQNLSSAAKNSGEPGNVYRDGYNLSGARDGDKSGTDNGNAEQDTAQGNGHNNWQLAWQDNPRTTLRQLAIKRADQLTESNWKQIKEDPAHASDHIDEYLNSIDADIKQRRRQSESDAQEAEDARTEAKQTFPEAGQAQDLKTLEILLEGKRSSLPEQLQKILHIHEQIKAASSGTLKSDAVTQAMVLDLRRQAGEELIADKEKAEPNSTKDLDPVQKKQLLGQLALTEQELKALKEALTKKPPEVEKKEPEKKEEAKTKEPEKKEPEKKEEAKTKEPEKKEPEKKEEAKTKEPEKKEPEKKEEAKTKEPEKKEPEKKEEAKKDDDNKSKGISWKIPAGILAGMGALGGGGYASYKLKRWLDSRREKQAEQFDRETANKLRDLFHQRNIPEWLFQRAITNSNWDSLSNRDNFSASPEAQRQFKRRLALEANKEKVAPEDKSALLDIIKQYGTGKSEMSPVDFLLSLADPLGSAKTALVDQAYKNIGRGLVTERQPVSVMMAEMQKVLDKNKKHNETERLELQYFIDTFPDSVREAQYQGHGKGSKYAVRQNALAAIEALRTQTIDQMRAHEQRQEAQDNEQWGFKPEEKGTKKEQKTELFGEMDRYRLTLLVTPTTSEKDDNRSAEPEIKARYLQEISKLAEGYKGSAEGYDTLLQSYHDAYLADKPARSPYQFYLDTLYPLHEQETELVKAACAGLDLSHETAPAEVVKARMYDILIDRVETDHYTDKSIPERLREDFVDVFPQIVANLVENSPQSNLVPPPSDVERERHLVGNVLHFVPHVEIVLAQAQAAAKSGQAAKQEAPKHEEPKREEPKHEEPKKEEPKQEEPKKEEPKQEEPKKEEPKQEEPKQEEPKKEEPKQEEPKKEELKKEQARELTLGEKLAIFETTQEILARSLVTNSMGKTPPIRINLSEGWDESEKQLEQQIEFLKLIASPEQNDAYDQFLQDFKNAKNAVDAQTGQRTWTSPADHLSAKYDSHAQTRLDFITETIAGMDHDPVVKEYLESSTVEAYEKVRDYMRDVIMPQQKFEDVRDSLVRGGMTDTLVQVAMAARSSDLADRNIKPRDFLESLIRQNLPGPPPSREVLESTFRELCVQEARSRNILGSTDPKDLRAIADWFKETYVNPRGKQPRPGQPVVIKPGEEMSREAASHVEQVLRRQAQKSAKAKNPTVTVETLLTRENYTPISQAMEIWRSSTNGQREPLKLSLGATPAEMELSRFNPHTRTWDKLTGDPMYKAFAEFAKERAELIRPTDPARADSIAAAAAELEAGAPAAGSEGAGALADMHNALVEATTKGNMAPLKAEAAKAKAESAKGGSRLGLIYIAGGALTGALGLMITVDSLRARTPSIRSRVNQPLGTTTVY